VTSPAASVARSKELHPEAFCLHPRCLWRTDALYCPRHAPRLVPLSDRDEEDAEHQAALHREDYA
jgi:hypothetical protein